jgi:hypothetical protein
VADGAVPGGPLRIGMTSEEGLPDARRATERREERRRWPVWLARAVIVVGLWLAFGFVRAPAVARDWLARQYIVHGQAVVNVAAKTAVPLVPPFWLVDVRGDVIEAGGTAPVYTSAQLLMVEPITGTVLVFGQG